MRRGLFLACAMLAVLLSGPMAWAQSDTYPSRTITILVPFPPGGSSDTILRPIAQKVAESLKTTIVIDNRAGAGGNVAALAVKQAAPDGYTLFLGNNGTLAINAALFADLKFDPIKDFAPITPLASFPSVLVVPTDLPAKSVKELADLAKTKAGGLNYASQGPGSGGHILGEMFRLKVGAPMIHVPYRGAAPAVTDVAGGRVDFLFSSYLSAAGQITGGKLRILGLTTTKRLPSLPDVPTMAEAGFPGTELDVWHGLLAPAGTPPAIIRKLNEEFIKAARTPEIAALLTPQAADLFTSSPEDFAKRLASDVAAMHKVVNDARIEKM